MSNEIEGLVSPRIPIGNVRMCTTRELPILSVISLVVIIVLVVSNIYNFVGISCKHVFAK